MVALSAADGSTLWAAGDDPASYCPALPITLVTSGLFGLLFSVLAIGFGRPLYQALGGEGEALHSALVYSNFIFLAAIPIWIVNLLSAALRGVGNVRVPALVTFVGAAVLVAERPRPGSRQ